MAIQWRLVDGETVFVNASLVDQDEWSFALPAALQPSIIEWRAILSGDGLNQTTPWFRIAAQEPTLEINQVQIYLQSLALGLFFIGLVLTLHNGFRHSENTTLEAASMVASDTESEPMPPIPDGGYRRVGPLSNGNGMGMNIWRKENDFSRYVSRYCN